MQEVGKRIAKRQRLWLRPCPGLPCNGAGLPGRSQRPACTGTELSDAAPRGLWRYLSVMRCLGSFNAYLIWSEL